MQQLGILPPVLVLLASLFASGSRASAPQVLATTTKDKLKLSLNGCVTGKQAAIVLPSANTAIVKSVVDSVGQQFPVTFLATDAHFNDPAAVHLLQAAQQTKLHTIAYQFNPEISRNAGHAQTHQISAALTKAKAQFKTHFKQPLMYVLIPSAAPSSFVDAVVRSNLYPIVPNADGDQIEQKAGKAMLASASGIVMSINPATAVNAPDYANALHAAGFEIVPLTHCLPVVYADQQVLLDVGVEDEMSGDEDDDLSPEMGNAVAGNGSGDSSNGNSNGSQDGAKEGGIPWGMIAIGVFVVAGIGLGLYFYRNQAA